MSGARARGRRRREDTPRVLLAHGDGGRLTDELLRTVILPALGAAGPGMAGQLDDAAVVPWPGEAAGAPGAGNGRLAITTDSFVVQPLTFPGGDIGKLAVTGTVNDLAVCGATPLYLTAGLILEEGLPLEVLRRVIDSLALAAREAGVVVVAGDTKVVPRGQADGLYVNTTGVGWLRPGCALGWGRIRPGDAVLLNGGIGEHGVAVLSRRAGLEFDSPVRSDCQALHGLALELVDRFGPAIRFMRDPTRGGLATVAKEIAVAAGLDLYLDEAEVPVTDAVRGACDLLGLDPLYLANEGKIVVVCAPEAAQAALAMMRSRPEGREARVVGRVAAGRGEAFLRTALGGTKYLDLLAGAPLPRIC